jgi:hypothetical protein
MDLMCVLSIAPSGIPIYLLDSNETTHLFLASDSEKFQDKNI